MTSRLQNLADNRNNFNSPAQHLTLSKSSKSATTKSNFWWDPPHALGLNFLREYLLPFALFGNESWYSGQAAQRISFFDKFQSFLWFSLNFAYFMLELWIEWILIKLDIIWYLLRNIIVRRQNRCHHRHSRNLLLGAYKKSYIKQYKNHPDSY